MSKKAKMIIAVLAGIVVAGLGIGGYFYSQWGSGQLKSLTLTAEPYTGGAIASDTTFVLTSQKDYSEDEVRDMVSISPYVGLFVGKVDKGTYHIRPDISLASNTEYTVTVTLPAAAGKRDWKFMTIDQFGVVSSYPYQSSAGVPVDSSIEFYFSETGVQGLEDYFEISPPVAGGSFTYSDNTAIFLHSENFKPDTRYTVTVKAGYGIGADQMAEDYTFFFNTQDTTSEQERLEKTYLNDDKTETVLPGELPVVIVGYNNVMARDYDYDVTIYKIPEADQYFWLMEENFGYRQTGEDYPVDKYTEVSQFTTKLEDMASAWGGTGYIKLPTDLEQGCYLVRTTTKGGYTGREMTFDKFIQISDISLYYQVVAGNGMLWLNDVTSGNPIEGAKVEMFKEIDRSGLATSTSDKEGVATFVALDEHSNAIQYCQITAPNGSQYLHYFYTESAPQDNLKEQYYTYLYTDRPIYRTTDTIKFWGVARPRKKDVPSLSEVRLGLISGYNTNLFNSVVVKVNPDGTFTGELSFENLMSSYYSVRMATLDGTNEFLDQYINIQDYKKPIYKADVTTSKAFYAKNEPVEVTSTITFFDGTPVSNMPLRVIVDNLYDDALEQSTDAKGQVQYVYNKNGEISAQVNTWYPYYVNYEMRNVQAEDQELYVYSGVYAFPKDMMVTGKISYTADVSLELRTNMFNLAGKDSMEDIWSTDWPDSIRGAAVSRPVKATVTKVEYIKTPTTVSYDPVYKRSVQNYRYNRVETIVGNYDFETTGGQYVLKGLPKVVDHEYYYVDIETTDTGDSPISERYYWGEWDESRYQNTLSTRKTYSFAYVDPNADKDKGVAKTANEYDSWWWWNPQAKFKVGEEVTLDLMVNGEKTTNSGRILYTVNQNKDIYHAIVGTNTNQVKYTPIEDSVPNFNIVGAYFDGKHIFPVSGVDFSLDYSDRILTLEVSADKESYSPGDTAKVTVKVKDQDGKPVAANVTLGVVDEAIFALEEQTIDMGYTFYAPVFYYSVRQGVSYVQHEFYPFTGGGKGDGEAAGMAPRVRKDFKDAVDVYTAKSNASGVATFTVPLPDNITSWRLTALALSDRNHVGSTTGDAIVTLPFFVQPIINKRYLEGDTVAMSARVYGTGAKAGDPVKYVVKVAPANGAAFEKDFAAKVGDNTQFTFDKLAAGDYTVTISATSGQLGDAVEHKFTVIKSAIEVITSQSFKLDGKLPISAVRYPVMLAVYDKANQPYLGAMGTLLCNASTRNDSLIIQKYLRTLIQDRFGDEELPYYLSTDEVEVGTVQSYEGGFIIFEYANVDVEITALAAAYTPDSIDLNAAKSFLQNVLYSRANYAPKDIAAAYMGLAAMGEKVGADVVKELENPQYNLQCRIYLATAMGFCGDTDGAGKWFEKNLQPLLQDKMATTFLPDNGSINSLYMTRTALPLAIMAKSPKVDGLVNYIVQQDNGVPAFELLYYINNFKGDPKLKQSFTYTDENGKTVTKELGGFCAAYVALSEQEVKNATFASKGGELYATAYFTTTPDQLQNFKPSQNFTITRFIDTPAAEARLGGVSTVTITIKFGPNAPDGFYNITEWVPSNMRFMMAERWQDYSDSNIYVWCRDDEQLLRFGLYRGIGTPSTVTITYQARAVLPGEAIGEGTYIFSPATGEGNFAERITVKPVK